MKGRRVKGPRFATEAAGDAFLDKCRALILADMWPGEHYGHVEQQTATTVGDVYASYMANRSLARQTADQYDAYWIKSIAPTFAKKPVATVSKQDVITWRDKTLAERRRIDVKVWQQFSALMNYAANSLDLIDKNPCRGLTFTPAKKTTAADKYALTLEELGAYLEATYKVRDPKVGLLLRVLAVTGLRNGEARALTVADLDLDSSTLEVRQGVAYVKAEDGEGREYVTGNTKTAAGHRVVTLPKQLIQELRDYLKKSPKLPTALLFPNRSGDYLDYSVIKRGHKRAQTVAGLEGRALTVTPQGLRRTMNVLMQRHGNATVGDSMQMFGWSDARMATTIYSATGQTRNAEAQATIINLATKQAN